MTEDIRVSDLHMLDRAPRVLDIKLAEALGFERPRKIRELIERNMDALRKHGEVFCAMEGEKPPHGGAVFDDPISRHGGAKSQETENTDDLISPHGGANSPYGGANPNSPNSSRRGRTSPKCYWLNREQAMHLCMFSRTERAIEVQVQLIKVYIAWERRQDMPAPTTLPAILPSPAAPYSDRPLAERREARRLCEAAYLIHGRKAAQQLWYINNLPAVTAERTTARFDEGRGYEALRQLLDATVEGQPVRALVEKAIHFDTLARDDLRENGVLVADDEAGIVIGRSVPFIRTLLTGGSVSARDLLGLPGARGYKVCRFDGRDERGSRIQRTSQGIFIPFATLDDEFGEDEAA